MNEKCSRTAKHFFIFCHKKYVEIRLVFFKNESNRSQIKIIADYPISSNPLSFEGWKYAKEFLVDTSLGAPPDQSFQNGQNWGLLTMNPVTSQKSIYASYRHGIKKLFEYTDGIRIDNILSFYRQYSIPNGGKYNEGIFLRQRPEILFAILSIEAAPSKGFVVGEDLGLVPPGLRKNMKRRNVSSLSILQAAPSEVLDNQSNSKDGHHVTMLNNHDFVPFKGFLSKKDLKIKYELGLIDKNNYIEELKARKTTIKNILSFFDQPSSTDASLVLSELIYKFVLSKPKNVLIINLDDLMSEESPYNVPSTSHEFSNWSRTYQKSIKDIQNTSSIQNILKKLSS